MTTPIAKVAQQTTTPLIPMAVKEKMTLPIAMAVQPNKGNCPLSKPFLDPHCGCLGDAPGCCGARFHGERRSHGRPSFQWSIRDTISIWLISHHFMQKHEAILASRLDYLFNEQLATSFVRCRNIMCSWTRDQSRNIMASKLNRVPFSPYACTTYEMY